MNETIERILAAEKFAVVGASRNPEKYGHMVFADLIAAGKTVWPVNPTATEIDGVQCFASLSGLPGRPDAIVYIVPPAATADGLKQASALGVRDVWLQPGAEPEDVDDLVSRLGLNGVYGGPCILVLLRTHGMIAG